MFGKQILEQSNSFCKYLGVTLCDSHMVHQDLLSAIYFNNLLLFALVKLVQFTLKNSE